MKFAILSLTFLLYVGFAYTQNTTASESHAAGTAEEFVDEYVNEPGGSRLVTNEFANIDGSPFITEEWLLAKITIDSSHEYENVLVRLNVYDNKIHFKDTEGKERMLTAKVKQVQITDASSSLNKAIFISGFTPNKNIFYRIVADGPKIRVLEKFSARKTDIKVFNGEPKFQFDIDKDFYFYSVQVKNMYGETKKCAEIMEVFGNDKKVAEFVSKNGIRCNKKDEILRLVEFYNSY